MTRALNLTPLLLQGTIDLTIGYDPPANAAPNLNDPDTGDAAADAGTFIKKIKKIKKKSHSQKWRCNASKAVIVACNVCRLSTAG